MEREPDGVARLWRRLGGRAAAVVRGPWSVLPVQGSQAKYIIRAPPAIGCAPARPPHSHPRSDLPVPAFCGASLVPDVYHSPPAQPSPRSPTTNTRPRRLPHIHGRTPRGGVSGDAAHPSLRHVPRPRLIITSSPHVDLPLMSGCITRKLSKHLSLAHPSPANILPSSSSSPGQT